MAAGRQMRTRTKGTAGLSSASSRGKGHICSASRGGTATMYLSTWGLSKQTQGGSKGLAFGIHVFQLHREVFGFSGGFRASTGSPGWGRTSTCGHIRSYTHLHTPHPRDF